MVHKLTLKWLKETILDSSTSVNSVFILSILHLLEPNPGKYHCRPQDTHHYVAGLPLPRWKMAQALGPQWCGTFIYKRIYLGELQK